ncbi:MAG: hypothetical protein DBY37_14200 [Desulfovibrionaceae bacterium]|nr:MAG: hypothetical protein DBY37_14200 [Desulfovibrionaceae bacterium]
MGCHLRHFMPYVKDHCAFVPESTAPERGRRLFPETLKPPGLRRPVKYLPPGRKNTTRKF